MGIEQLSKEELIKLLGDKKETLSLLSEKQEQETVSYMTPEFVRALSNARCRSCVGRVYEVVEPVPGDLEGRTRKVTKHEGQPYTIEQGGTELACRTCKHVRQGLKEAGVHGIAI